MAYRFSSKFADSRQYISSPVRAHWDGVELITASENITQPTVWKINEVRHTLVVHLGGTIENIETQINQRSSIMNPPVAGEFWLIPSNTDYQTFTQGDKVNYAEIYFPSDFVGNLIREPDDHNELVPQLGVYDSFIFENVRTLISISNNTDDISQLSGLYLNRVIGLHLFRKYKINQEFQKKQVQPFGPNKYKQLHEYILDNLGDHLTIEKLSNVAEMNPNKLLRVFRRSFGTAPAQYIIEQRLRRVRWLLSNTKKDILTIAVETGFSSHSHLTNIFKQHTGVSPQKFRSLI